MVDLKVIKHFWLSLPGPVWFSAVDIYREEVQGAADNSVFVELGAWKGRSTVFMAVEIALSEKKIRFFSVDHWKGSLEEPAHRVDEDVAAGMLFKTFKQNIAPVDKYIEPLILDSALAAKKFDDNSVDFIYVDASHTYEGVFRDLEAWFPKLKRGGCMAGDDWCFKDSETGFLSVQQAVKDFFGALGLDIEVLKGNPNVDWLQWRVKKP